MPYIEPKMREHLDPYIDKLVGRLYGLNDGDVNYVITRILNGIYDEDKYAIFNRVIGVLECAKQEFYRRRIAPYENKKIKENGDVY